MPDQGWTVLTAMAIVPIWSDKVLGAGIFALVLGLCLIILGTFRQNKS